MDSISQSLAAYKRNLVTIGIKDLVLLTLLRRDFAYFGVFERVSYFTQPTMTYGPRTIGRHCQSIKLKPKGPEQPHPGTPSHRFPPWQEFCSHPHRTRSHRPGRGQPIWQLQYDPSALGRHFPWRCKTPPRITCRGSACWHGSTSRSWALSFS